MTIREELAKKIMILAEEIGIQTLPKDEMAISDLILSAETLKLLIPLYEVTMGSGMSKHVTVKEGE